MLLNGRNGATPAILSNEGIVCQAYFVTPHRISQLETLQVVEGVGVCHALPPTYDTLGWQSTQTKGLHARFCHAVLGISKKEIEIVFFCDISPLGPTTAKHPKYIKFWILTPFAKRVTDTQMAKSLWKSLQCIEG